MPRARAFASAGISAQRTPSASNPAPGNMNSGTYGGLRAASSRPGRMNLAVGDEMYLWILVLVEAFSIGLFRKKFRRYHGG